ncbi:MAG TPA: NADH:ubiquinone oxidoreductase [Mycobacteriales bacterium]|nr:NADH:ubiquinone oxidoreductase [Mycobacteriales bacterium]
MAWAARGLRNGVVTSRYPQRRDGYADGFRGAVRVREPVADPTTAITTVCPTGAISADPDLTLDRGRCILCGACVVSRPDLFEWTAGSETARLDRPHLVVPETLREDPASLTATRSELAGRVRALRQSVHIRHVDAGSDGSEEWEIHALTNPTYDVHRLGIFFTASPRHADILMVTGAGARGMIAPLRRTYEAMPNPIVVIAVGTDAMSDGLVSPSYATTGGVTGQVDVDVFVPGSPPPPFAILHGILLALGRLPEARARSAP